MAKQKQIPVLDRLAKGVVSAQVVDIMADDYVSYAYMVNLGRAIPGADGLKPVQRRILYAMRDLGLASDKPYRKSARVVGEVMGRLHAHAGSYGALVNMATEFGNRYVAISGHGNFGSVSDGPAAERYTECRLSQFSEQVLLRDLDDNWIEYKDTYDAAWTEPKVLPARLPMLLLRDTAGIGVAAACSHVSYNLTEVAALAKAAVLANGKLKPEQGIDYVTMPDFAMGANVLVDDDMRSAIITGTGCIRQFATIRLDEATHSIIATELPQDVSPETVLEQTYKKVKDGTLDRRLLRDARDESDREGTRVVWEVNPKSWRMAPWLLQELLRYTSLKTTTSVNAVSVDFDGKSYSCKGVAEVANEWAKYRIAYEQRKLEYQIVQLKERDELLKGMLIALENIIAVAQALIDGRELNTLKLGLTDRQISAIESMPLRSLRSKNRDKLRAEVTQIDKDLTWRQRVISKPQFMSKHICSDVDTLVKQFGDDRRTKQYKPPAELADASVIATQLAAEAAANVKLGWIVDNRVEGLEHTYYRSSKKLSKFPCREITKDAELGIFAIMSNGWSYWLPATAMPTDAKSAEQVKVHIAAYTGKPFEPGTQVLWSDIIDKASAADQARELVLFGTRYDRNDTVCKRMSLNEFTLFTKRKKTTWLGIRNAAIYEPAVDKEPVKTITYLSGDRVAIDMYSKTPKLAWQANGSLMRRDDVVTSVEQGNVTNKKRLSNLRG